MSLIAGLLWFAGNVAAVPTADDVTGCYTLRMGPWEPAVQASDVDYLRLPATIELTSRPSERVGGVKQMLPSQGVKPSIHKFSYWNSDNDHLYLVWSNGFSGIGMTLTRTAQGWVGEAVMSWDYERESERSQVVAQKVSCG
jgi:hypothetical protein